MSAKAAPAERKLYAIAGEDMAWWAPSSREGVKPHRVDVRVMADGGIEPECDCPGFYGHRYCWHCTEAVRIVEQRAQVRALQEKRKAMSNNNLSVVPSSNGVAEIVESVVLAGDLGKLSPGDRVAYYQRTCDSLGLNPLTKPFDYINLNGKLTLYATRTATDQLRRIHGISVEIVSREWLKEADIYVVTARARDAEGRTDEAIGAVNVRGLTGDNMANALMKAETKAKRRVTLGIAGLGWLDESEAASTGGHSVSVDNETGEVVDAPARRAARAQEAHERPERLVPAWAAELGALMGEADLRMHDFEAELGWDGPPIAKSVFVDLVNLWLAQHKGQGVAELVAAVLEGAGAEGEQGDGKSLPFED